MEKSPSAFSYDEVNIHEYFRVVRRGKWIILGITLLSILGATYYTFTVTPVYQASVSILVGNKNQATPSFIDLNGSQGERNLKNEIEILGSRQLAEQVADSLTSLPDRQKSNLPILHLNRNQTNSLLIGKTALINRLLRTMSFSPVRDADILIIQARSNQALEAAVLANTYAQSYYDRNLESSRDRSRSVRQFLESQLSVRKDSLNNSENAVRHYQERTGVSVLDEDAKQTVETISQFEAQRNQAQIDLESATRTLNSIRTQLQNQQPDISKSISDVHDPYIKRLQDELAQKKVDRDVLIVQNPVVASQQMLNDKIRQLDDQINKLEALLVQKTKEYLASLKSGGTGSSNPGDPVGYMKDAQSRIAQLQLEVDALTAKIKALNNVIRDYEQKFEGIPKKNIELARLERQKLSNEKSFLFLQDKYEESVLAERSQFGNVDIFEPAIVPSQPISPNHIVNISIGLLVGLGLGFGFVFSREFLNTKVRKPSDLRHLGFAVLAEIPKMNKTLERSDASGNGRNGSSSHRLDPHLIAYFNPLSPISGAYRRLATNIRLANPDKPLQSIVLTSAGPLEGKSTTASNLAISLATSSRKTLLVDLDLHKPRVHHIFGLPHSPGFTDVVFDKNSIEECVHKIQVENLSILTSGSTIANPASILGSEKVKNLLREFRSQFDYVIYDAPPVISADDVLAISEYVDGVLFIASAGSTTSEVVQHAREMLESVGANLIGAALNNFDATVAYGRYYNHYYNYYGSQRTANKRR